MRERKVIEKEAHLYEKEQYKRILLEVLLDIREILEHAR